MEQEAYSEGAKRTECDGAPNETPSETENSSPWSRTDNGLKLHQTQGSSNLSDVTYGSLDGEIDQALQQMPSEKALPESRMPTRRIRVAKSFRHPDNSLKRLEFRPLIRRCASTDELQGTALTSTSLSESTGEANSENETKSGRTTNNAPESNRRAMMRRTLSRMNVSGRGMVNQKEAFSATNHVDKNGALKVEKLETSKEKNQGFDGRPRLLRRTASMRHLTGRESNSRRNLLSRNVQNGDGRALLEGLPEKGGALGRSSSSTNFLEKQQRSKFSDSNCNGTRPERRQAFRSSVSMRNVLDGRLDLEVNRNVTGGLFAKGSTQNLSNKNLSSREPSDKVSSKPNRRDFMKRHHSVKVMTVRNNHENEENVNFESIDHRKSSSFIKEIGENHLQRPNGGEVFDEKPISVEESCRRTFSRSESTPEQVEGTSRRRICSNESTCDEVEGSIRRRLFSSKSTAIDSVEGSSRRRLFSNRSTCDEIEGSSRRKLVSGKPACEDAGGSSRRKLFSSMTTFEEVEGFSRRTTYASHQTSDEVDGFCRRKVFSSQFTTMEEVEGFRRRKMVSSQITVEAVEGSSRRRLLSSKSTCEDDAPPNRLRKLGRSMSVRNLGMTREPSSRNSNAKRAGSKITAGRHDKQEPKSATKPGEPQLSEDHPTPERDVLKDSLLEVQLSMFIFLFVNRFLEGTAGLLSEMKENRLLRHLWVSFLDTVFFVVGKTFALAVWVLAALVNGIRVSSQWLINRSVVRKTVVALYDRKDKAVAAFHDRSTKSA